MNSQINKVILPINNLFQSSTSGYFPKECVDLANKLDEIRKEIT